MKRNSKLNNGRIFTFRKKRAVSEIIGSLLLVAITVVGATILTTFLNDSFAEGGLSTATQEKVGLTTINLMGYDTRDSVQLMKFTNLDNQFDGQLCGNCTIAFPNKIPEDGGSEFIVLQIENKGVDSVFLHHIYLNNIGHTWDSQTSGILLDAEFTDITGKYPEDGKFSILPLNNPPIQTVDNQIQSGQIVNLLVKLGSNEDMDLNKSIRVKLNVGKMISPEFIIESGDAR